MTGYNPPTTNAWDLIKRREAERERATREALRVGGTQPFQTTRKTGQAVVRLDEQQEELTRQQEALEAAQEQLAEVVERVAQQQNAIPVTFIQQSIASGFTPPDSWQTVATVAMPRPEGKGASVTHAIGTVDFAFDSEPAQGSIVFPAPRLRVVISGDIGLDSGVRGNYDISDTRLRINYAGTAQHVHPVAGSGDVVAQLQLAANWPDGDRGSYNFGAATAQLVLLATFTP